MASATRPLSAPQFGQGDTARTRVPANTDHHKRDPLSIEYQAFAYTCVGEIWMKKIKTAIVGTGFMGKVHAENVRRLGNVEIAAVVGSRPERAQRFAENASIPFATSNIK